MDNTEMRSMRSVAVRESNRGDPSWALLVVAILSAGLMVGTAVAGAWVTGETAFLWPMLLVAWPVVAGILVARRPEHLVGKLMVAFSAFFSVSTSAESYTYVSQAGFPLPATEAVAWLAVWAITPLVTIVLFLVAVFPSGTLGSSWLRWPLRVAAVITAFALVGRAVLPVEMAWGDGVFTNPWGLEALAPLVGIEEAGFTVVILLTAAAVADLVVRWRRSAGVERLQMQALAFTVAAFFVAVLLSMPLQLTDLPPGVIETVETLVWVPGLAALPVAIGVAVLRYRLYEIDRVVSRTVTYAVVVTTLGAVFLSVVAVLTFLLPTESDLAVAGSTLAVAALFNPLRRRVQLNVDRRFNRAKYDGEKVVSQFVGSLRDQIDLEEMVSGWVQAVDQAMQPSSSAVWIKQEVSD